MSAKGESKKFKIKKELKFRVPKETLRRIERACKGFGGNKRLAEVANIREEYIPILTKSKLATKTMLERILAGVEIVEKQKAA